MQTRRARARHAELARSRTRAKYHVFVRNRLAAGQRNSARGALDRRDGRAGTNVEAELVVCFLLEQVSRIGLGHACENGLGQRRTFVWRVGFLAEENNAAGESFAAQRLCRPSSGLSG